MGSVKYLGTRRLKRYRVPFPIGRRLQSCVCLVQGRWSSSCWRELGSVKHLKTLTLKEVLHSDLDWLMYAVLCVPGTGRVETEAAGSNWAALRAQLGTAPQHFRCIAWDGLPWSCYTVESGSLARPQLKACRLDCRQVKIVDSSGYRFEFKGSGPLRITSGGIPGGQRSGFRV